MAAPREPRAVGSTTGAGAPAPSDRHSLTVGPNGPLLLHDVHFLEQMAHFNREKVPERQPHAKGAGAFGVFETTEDVSAFTKAALFRKGARTEMLARFSTVAGEAGSPDTWRDVRGFSLKFYTEEGNYDLVGNNTPIFFVRDPMKFPHFIRSQKRLPDSGLRSNHMQWDFWTSSPESAQVTYLMGERGLPRTWRHMNGYGSHTFMWISAGGERFWVKYHFRTNQGLRFFTNAEAADMAGQDADFVGDELIGAFDTWNVGAHIKVSLWDASVDFMFNQMGDGADIRAQYGAWPGYLKLINKDFDRAGETAWGIKVSYDFTRLGASGLTAYFWFAQGTGAIDPTTRARAPNQREYDFDVTYTVPRGPLKGLQMQARAGLVDIKGTPGLLPDIRLILNWPLQLF